MEIIINKQELTEEIEKVERPNRLEFNTPQEEIEWMLKKHEETTPRRHEKETSQRLTEADIRREETITLLDDIKNIIRIVKRILKGDIYAEKETTNWVTPYDSANDVLYVGRMTRKEFNSIKKKWGI